MSEDKQTLRVSLIPEGGEEFKPINTRRRALGLVLFLGLAVALLIASALYLKQIQRRNSLKISEIDSRILTIKNETSSLSGDYEKVSRLARQLKAAESLLLTHPSYVAVLNLIEARTIPEIFYTNLVSSLEGRTIALEARALSFDDASRSIVAFREAKDKVERVNVTSLSAELDEDGNVSAIKYILTLILKNAAFR